MNVFNDFRLCHELCVVEPDGGLSAMLRKCCQAIYKLQATDPIDSFLHQH